MAIPAPSGVRVGMSGSLTGRSVQQCVIFVSDKSGRPKTCEMARNEEVSAEKLLKNNRGKVAPSRHQALSRHREFRPSQLLPWRFV